MTATTNDDDTKPDDSVQPGKLPGSLEECHRLIRDLRSTQSDLKRQLRQLEQLEKRKKPRGRGKI